MSTDGFTDFSMGDGDENIGKIRKRFTGEAGRTYRLSFVAFSEYGADGLPTEGAKIQYAGCERIFIECLKKNVLVTPENAPAMAEFGQAGQAVATLVCVWPTDKDGDLDVASLAAGKGWAVQPWVLSAAKYAAIKTSHKRFSLRTTDLAVCCTDSKYQKMTFSPEPENLIVKLLASSKPESAAIARKIIAEARACIPTLRAELAVAMTPQQLRDRIREAGGTVAGSSMPASATNAGGGHASKDVDSLLNDIL